MWGCGLVSWLFFFVVVWLVFIFFVCLGLCFVLLLFVCFFCQMLLPLPCTNVLVSMLISIPEHPLATCGPNTWGKKTASSLYSKRNSSISKTPIKEWPSEKKNNLWNARWAWLLNLNLKDIEAISHESEPSWRCSSFDLSLKTSEAPWWLPVLCVLQPELLFFWN